MSLNTDQGTAARPQIGELDPITFSVILSRFDAIAAEMTLVLERTAWSPILALGRDYSCAIYDADARQVCMMDALPCHTNSMHLVLREIAETFAGRVSEGDVLACNHPYRGNTHVGDLVTATPVFVDGRHLFWSVTKGHQQDCGAYVPSTMPSLAADVWQEGLQIPPIKLYDKGEPCKEVIDLYLSNVRYPDRLYGDLLAQIGSIGKGQSRLLELADEYGADNLMRYVDEIIAYADRRMSEELRAMPDGEYSGETWLDSDGATGLNIPIKARVTIAGDDVTVDLTGSGPQSARGLNGTFATSLAAAGTPFMYYIAPDIPHNHGCIRHIDAIAPPGTICNAEYPGSTALATICPSTAIQDAINRALVTAIPDRVVAGGTRCAIILDVAGVDARSGEAWGVMMFNCNGGGGAVKGADGWPMWTSAAGLGGLKAYPIEQLELLYPLRIDSMEVATDSMGAGQWIGGPGLSFELRPLAGDLTCSTYADGFENPPYGVLGGTPGVGGGQYIEGADGVKRFMSGTAYFRIQDDERYVGLATGGGGYGAPTERDVELVRRDVRDGFTSRERAAEVFGVVLTDDADPSVDESATADLRARMRASEQLPPTLPEGPGAGEWRTTEMTPNDVYLLNHDDS